MVREALDDACKSRTGLKCTADCKEIVLCPQADQPGIHVQTCPSGNFCGVPEDSSDGLPNCEQKTCVSDSFLCTTPGGVPNPVNASAYYLCPGSMKPGIPRPCESGQNFNSTLRACDANSEPINLADCAGNTKLGGLDAEGVFCYVCDDLGNPLVYLCDLDKNDSFFYFGFKFSQHLIG